MIYMTKEALRGLKQYQYKSMGTTWLDDLHQPFWNGTFATLVPPLRTRQVAYDIFGTFYSIAQSFFCTHSLHVRSPYGPARRRKFDLSHGPPLDGVPPARMYSDRTYHA